MKFRIELAAVVASLCIAGPALAQAQFSPGTTVWGQPPYEQWSKCVITSAQPNSMVSGGVQYEAMCDLFMNGKVVPSHSVLMAQQVKPYTAAPPAEAGGGSRRTAEAAPRAPIDCDTVPRGRAGGPDPTVIRGLIQCGLESQVSTGVVPLASDLSITPKGSQPWRLGYAYQRMAGGQGGDYGGGGPGTTVYLYDVRGVVTYYGSSGADRTSYHATWKCFFSNGGRWVCGLGE